MTVRKAGENTVVKHQLVVFVVVSIFIAWLSWSPIIASYSGLLTARIEITSVGGFILYIIAMTSMWLVAIPLIAARQGFEGVKNAYKNLFSGRNNVLWFSVAVLIPLAIEIGAPAIWTLFAGKLNLSALSWPYLLFMLILGVHLSLVLALGGTGYALQLLATGSSRFAATLITSAYTMVWIAPMYMEVVLRHPGYPALWYAVGFMPAAVMILWLCHATKIVRPCCYSLDPGSR